MTDSNSRPTPSLSEIVRKVEPSLVCIRTPSNSGSGFVVDGLGNVITNAHVIEHYTAVEVEFVNGTNSWGMVVGVNWELDLACVRLTSQVDTMPLPMGDSDSVLVGEDVLAMGYPLSEILQGSPTVTRGIISARRSGRLQTDAAINPGNSGGPLVNSQGDVIGVNTSVIDTVAGRNIDGIGFAIPISVVRAELEVLSSGDADQHISDETPIDIGKPRETPWLLMAGRLNLLLPNDWNLLNGGEWHAFFGGNDKSLFLHLSIFYSTAEEGSNAFLQDEASLAFEAMQADEDGNWIELDMRSDGLVTLSGGNTIYFAFEGMMDIDAEKGA